MSEATLRNYARKGLNEFGVLSTHHEDMLNIGLPDLSYGGYGANGWIELKWLPEWPKRDSTIVKIEHYTKEQRFWLLQRGRTGGRCWLLLRVDREHLLFDHEAAQKVGLVTRAELSALAMVHWPGGIDFDQLARILTRKIK